VFLFLASPGWAGGTYISTDVTSNTTWDLAGSPYTITATITVLSGKTLTIQPGVVVGFTGFYSLQVAGTLLADTVTFTSFKTPPSKGDWLEVRFLSTSGMNSSVRNSLLEDAFYGFHCIGASPTLEGNVIQNNTNYGVYVEGKAAPLLQGNTIRGNIIGIYADARSGGAFSSTISGNTISGNSHGLYVDASGQGSLRSEPQVSSNVISGNSSEGVFYSGNVVLFRDITEGCERGWRPLKRGNDFQVWTY